jgi:flagellar M-ring protein FliF
MAVLALVTLGLGLFVLRPILADSRRSTVIDMDKAPLALPPSAGSDGTGIRVVSGEIHDIGDLPDMPVVAHEGFAPDDDPMQRLRRLIEERQAESVEILRGWLEAEEEPA